MERKRLAVIGAGVAGLGAAWLLSRRHEVRLYERERALGGHSHTVAVDSPHGELGVDTGFVVYNEPNYPQLTALFAHLGVETQATDMSFAASIDDGRVEYAGSDLNTLFAQRANLVSPAYWGMLRDILRFNRDAKRSLRTGDADGLDLGAYLARGGYGERLVEHYLLPMAAAIWSCPTATMRAFPASGFLRFFANHGLLDVVGRPQWQTVTGGSRRYVEKLAARLDGRFVVGHPATRVSRQGDGVWVTAGDGSRERYDGVVLACHADDALRLIDRPLPNERAVLGRFRYQQNRTLLHCDATLMPRQRRVWSSWNYLAQTRRGATERVSVTYWMNRLQGLPGDRQYFVSLNPLREPSPAEVVAEMTYDHPVFDADAVRAQPLLDGLQGRDRLWFCGSYAGYGFHEDAFASAVRVAARLGASTPWATPSTAADDDAPVARAAAS
ncbi:MAG: FAD-dependent oxidoreductase [Gammaproteobacteria bacterium]|nr:FAD-dependent oxidoreductase [Gammaproteobacteria bacterium]